VAMPAAILSVSAWYDMELKNYTITSNAKNDKLLSRSILERFREAWLADTGTAWNDPRVNLLYADLAGVPPIQLYYGDHELFVGEITEFAKRAKDAGVDISMHSVPEGQHNFILGAGRVPEVDEAIEHMGQWLRSRLWSAKREAAFKASPTTRKYGSCRSSAAHFHHAAKASQRNKHGIGRIQKTPLPRQQ